FSAAAHPSRRPPLRKGRAPQGEVVWLKQQDHLMLRSAPLLRRASRSMGHRRIMLPPCVPPFETAARNGRPPQGEAFLLVSRCKETPHPEERARCGRASRRMRGQQNALDALCRRIDLVAADRLRCILSSMLHCLIVDLADRATRCSLIGTCSRIGA